eukprot:6628630-Prymnesium_polylepis.1
MPKPGNIWNDTVVALPKRIMPDWLPGDSMPVKGDDGATARSNWQTTPCPWITLVGPAGRTSHWSAKGEIIDSVTI